MNKRKIYQVVVAVLLVIVLIFGTPEIINHHQVEAKNKNETYIIGPNSKPCDNSNKYSTYNKYTKQYYLVLSYLKRLEKEGGGTLILQRGTYTISNTLYVPSNVTILLKGGVKIVKGKKTGIKNLEASNSIFMLCPYSKQNTKGAFHKYNGVKNVSIIAEESATIDLAYKRDCVGIMMAHNQNITISGITFQNMNSGHFIELDASKNVEITDCIFKNHKDSPNNNKEAINLDTPDKTTNGFHAVWTSYDKTANYNVNINNCVFSNLERAIGTHKYSGGKYHTKIKIYYNTIVNCDLDAIRIMNWKDIDIRYNEIANIGKGKSGIRAILVSGASKITITDNIFSKVSRPIQLMPWKNSGGGEQYKTIYNTVTKKEIEKMANNTLVDGEEYFIRINNTYQEFVKDTKKILLNRKS